MLLLLRVRLKLRHAAITCEVKASTRVCCYSSPCQSVLKNQESLALNHESLKYQVGMFWMIFFISVAVAEKKLFYFVSKATFVYLNETLLNMIHTKNTNI